MTASEPLLYSVEEAARLMGGIDRSTVYKLIAEGRLAKTKIGRRTLIHRDEIERYVVEQAA